MEENTPEFPDVNSKEFKKNVRKTKKQFKLASKELERRYQECDNEGHYSPNSENNICYHCFRQLKYKTPEIDAIMEERKKIPMIHKPLDATYWKRERERKIEHQKSLDLSRGLRRILELYID